MIQSIYKNKFFDLAMYTFAGFGFELVLLIIEGIIGIDLGTTTGQLIHFSVTIIVWLVVIITLCRVSKAKYNFDPLSFKGELQNNKLLYIILVSLGIVCFTLYLNGGIKITSAYNYFVTYFENGTLLFIMQHLYYAAEVGLVVLLIAFGQKLGEDITNQLTIPFGGIVLALSWGLVHILTKSLYVGAFTMIISMGFGYLYILLRKNIYLTYPLILLLFIL